jgi:hypothetical protein
MPSGVSPPSQYPQSWIERFRLDPLARQVIVGLAARSQEIWNRTFAALNRQSPEYRNAVDDDFTVESRTHCGELLRAIVAIASGQIDPDDPFAFVRKHAQWRARHQVPLVASLHAYRLAHKTYWDFTREALEGKSKGALSALATLSDFWLELFEAVGAMLEEAHVGEEARIEAENSPAYGALLDGLLRGEEPGDRGARQLGRVFGIRSGLSLAVVIVRPAPTGDSQPVDAEVGLRALMRLIHQLLPAPMFGSVIALRSQEIVAVLSAARDTAAQASKVLRAGAKRPREPGVRATIGISLDKTGITELPDALAEARIASDLADCGRPIVRFADIELLDFLIRRADKAALRLIPGWARQALLSNSRSTDLVRTIHAFAQCDLRVKDTARLLRIHTNTVYFRLNQIKELTGVDPRTFAGTSLLLTALRLLETQQNNGG